MEEKLNNLQIYCPVIRGKIHINSGMLDDIGQFTKFILWAIGNGYKLVEIDQIIELGEYVILEEVNYLCKIGFIIEGESTYSLSENGMTYLKLIETLDYINSLELCININCFTGEVQKYNELNYDKDALEEDVQKLPEMISRQFFYNKNYANSREFIIQNYPELFQDLSEVHKDSIHIEIECDKETKYVIYNLTEIPSADWDFSNEPTRGSTLLLKRSIQNFSYNISDERLENYKNVLSTLAMIEKFDKELLSSKSIDIIHWDDEEKKINKGKTVLCVDACKGEIITLVTNNHVKQRKAVIQLPEYQYEISEDIVREKLGIDNTHWVISEPKVETTKVFQLVPFDLFVQKEEVIDEECGGF